MAMPVRLDDKLLAWASVLDDASVKPAAERWSASNPCPVPLTQKQEHTVVVQFGTLGSGNHFFEVCLDERDVVWVVLHSGSRGIGNQLAQRHISKAKEMAKAEGTPLEDPDLAYFVEGTPPFDEYIAAMPWSQAYAFAKRSAMMDGAVASLLELAGTGREGDRINSHHNFAVQERHDGRDLWIMRDEADLVEVEHELHQVLNYKGV